MPTLGDITVNVGGTSPVHTRNNLLFKRYSQTQVINGPFTSTRTIYIENTENKGINALMLGVILTLNADSLPLTINIVSSHNRGNTYIRIEHEKATLTSVNSVLLLGELGKVISGEGHVSIPTSGVLKLSSIVYFLDEPSSNCTIQVIPEGNSPVDMSVYVDLFEETVSL